MKVSSLMFLVSGTGLIGLMGPMGHRNGGFAGPRGEFPRKSLISHFFPVQVLDFPLFPTCIGGGHWTTKDFVPKKAQPMELSGKMPFERPKEAKNGFCNPLVLHEISRNYGSGRFLFCGDAGLKPRIPFETRRMGTGKRPAKDANERERAKEANHRGGFLTADHAESPDRARENYDNDWVGTIQLEKTLALAPALSPEERGLRITFHSWVDTLVADTANRPSGLRWLQAKAGLRSKVETRLTDGVD